jgi:hypothetical protein
MRNVSILGVAGAAVLVLGSCSGGGGSAEPSTDATEEPVSGGSSAYSEDELRELISGMTDAEGNELQLYSEDQVEQGEQWAQILLGTASVEPGECKSIATAGLLDSVEDGEVAVAMSGGDQPGTLSAQSSAEGPDAAELLGEISASMDQCSEFTVEAVGRSIEVSSEELEAETDGEETFATVSTRAGDSTDMLMQVSAAQGQLLVVATTSGTDLGEEDQQELEDLVNEVLSKADDGSTETATDGA